MPLEERPFIVGHASFTPFAGGDAEAELLRDRIILVGSFDNVAAELVTARLLILERQDPAEEICLYVNSEGGPVEAALAMHDAINFVSCPVATVCIGQARGGAALLVAAGEPGRRAALPNSRFMLRGPSGEFEGSATDAEAIAAEAGRLRETVVDLFARYTRLSSEELRAALERSRFLGAEEAVRAGLVDKVIERPPRAWRGIIG